MAAPCEKDPLVGQVLDNFRILELLGANETGRIYQAIAQAERRVVALKLLPEHLLREPKARERFVREIKLLRAVQHPGIVRLLGHNVRLPRPYYVTEFVAGESLDRVIGPGRGLWPPGELLRLAGELLEAVQALHEAGVLHRNLVPSKIMHDAWGGYRIVDFGVAYCEGWKHITEGGDVLGALAYQPPEVLADGDFDARSDLYQLGVLLTEATAGRNLADLRAAQPRDKGRGLPGLQTLRDDLPPAFCSLVARLVAEDPARRYPDARAALAELSEVLAEHERTQPAITAIAAAAEAGGPPSRRRLGAAVIGGGLALALVLGAAWKLRQQAGYRAFRVTQRVSASHLTVEWFSGLPHPTALEVVDVASGDRRVIEVSGPVDRQHRITVPLRPGRLTRFAAVLPDGGRALEGETTVPPDGLLPQSLHLGRTDPGRVDLELTTRVPVRVRVHVAGAGGERLEGASESAGTHHELSLTLPSPEFRALSASLVLEDLDGATRELALELGELDGAARKLRGELRRAVEAVVQLLGRAGALDGVNLRRHLEATGLPAAWRHRHPLARALLASAEVPWSTKRTLLRLAARARDVDDVLRMRGEDESLGALGSPGDPLVPERLPALPPAGPSMRDLLPEVAVLQPEAVAAAAPGARPRLELDLELSSREHRALERAVLYLRFQALDPGLVVEADWNGEEAFSVRARDLGDGHREGCLAIPVPGGLVKVGRNRLALLVRPLLGSTQAPAATLTAVRMFLVTP